ncbi:MAG TPA: aminotransferase class V-fold PLP-dependent enzyme [Opitutaceae bacterium]|nr:aminotransferase class V-fold PLP-dependent enzyme [Opitutaceae bacterium]
MSPTELSQLVQSKSVAELAGDAVFWARLADEYERDDSFIPLNYGYYHPALRAVLEAEIAAAREINRRGSQFKWLDSAPLLEATRTELAAVAGADPSEVVITRNASEALNIVIGGVRLKAGDEIIASDQDYTAATQALEQRMREDGVVVRQARIPLDPATDDEVVEAFAAEMSARTRLVLVTHAIHVTGHLLPARKICALARERGIPTLVDAAHSFAQVEFSVRDLGCDFLAASLHKWLGGPLGTGLLYVRREHIPELRPLFADTVCARDDVRRFERFGNRPDSLQAGLREAIRWHRTLGTGTKRERLRDLHRRWAEPLRADARFRVLSPRTAERQSAIGLVTLNGIPADALHDRLYREHRVFTTVASLGGEPALRITPGLPTSEREIDALIEALLAVADAVAKTK